MCPLSPKAEILEKSTRNKWNSASNLHVLCLINTNYKDYKICSKEAALAPLARLAVRYIDRTMQLEGCGLRDYRCSDSKVLESPTPPRSSMDHASCWWISTEARATVATMYLRHWSNIWLSHLCQNLLKFIHQYSCITLPCLSACFLRYY
jgi:hypothetical protein